MKKASHYTVIAIVFVILSVLLVMIGVRYEYGLLNPRELFNAFTLSLLIYSYFLAPLQFLISFLFTLIFIKLTKREKNFPYALGISLITAAKSVGLYLVFAVAFFLITTIAILPFALIKTGAAN